MGKNLKIVLGLFAVAVVLEAGRMAFTAMNQPSDQVLIERALDEALRAGREGKPGGVLELLSKNLTINGQPLGAESRQIANFVRDQKPTVTVPNRTAVVRGEEGRIESNIAMDLGILGAREMKNVSMIFRREDSTEMLIIPTRKWKLVEVRVPDNAVQDLMQ